MAELRVKGTGTLKLFENDNTSSVTIASPASLAADRTITLPDASVTLASGTMLATDGSGASLTALDADNISAGTLAVARGGTGATTLAGAGLASTPAFLASMSGATSIADSTSTTVVFNHNRYDSASGYDNTNGRWTPGVAGKYQITTSLRAYSFTCNTMRAEINISGSLWAGVYDDVSISGDSINVSAIADLGASDYVTVIVYQDSGGTVSLDYSSGSLQTWFQGFKLIT